VRIFKNGEEYLSGGVLSIGVTLGEDRTMLLMVVTKTFAADSGRTALGSVDLNVGGNVALRMMTYECS
jgi:hypothetical protein